MKLYPNRPQRRMYAWYGIAGLLSLGVDVALTRLTLPGARLIRRPAYIRGRRWIEFGPNFTCGRGVRLDALGNPSTKGPIIRFGADVAINDYVHIGAVDSISIGNRVLIASKVFITDHDHGSYGKDGLHTDPRTPPGDRELITMPVVIEDDVWLGEFVSVLAGVRIGQGSIVGTMSTVTRSIPPYSIAIGTPARVVKQFRFETATWEPV